MTTGPATRGQSADSLRFPGAPAESAHGRVAQYGGLLSLSAALVGALSYTTTLLMTHALSPSDFSQFAAAQMLLGTVGIVTSALVPLPLSHAVAAHPPGSEERRNAMAFAALVSILAGLVAALVTGLVTAGFGTSATAVAVALSSFVLFLGAAPSGWFQGELRFGRYSLKSISEIGVRFLFSMLVIALSWGAPGAVVGFAVGGLALLVTPRSYLRDLAWRPGVLADKWRWTETADIAFTLCIVSVLVGLDVVLIAFLDGGSQTTAGFQALASIAKAPVYVAAGTVIVVFPLLRRPGVRIDKVLTAALRSFGLLAFFACAVIAAAPPILVAWVLPERYHSAAALLPWLAISGLSYATLTVFSVVLLGLRSYRRCQLGLLFAVAAIPGGLLVGWELEGAEGLAAGCAIASIVSAVVMVALAFPSLPAHSGLMLAGGVLLATSYFLVLVVLKQVPVAWLLAVTVTGCYLLLRLRDVRRRSAESPAASTTITAAAPPWWVRVQASEFLRQKAPRLVGAMLCAAIAFLVRSIGLLRSFELWVDEMLYAMLGKSVSDGQILPWLADGPFFLHPPGFFWLEGAIIRLGGVEGDNLELVMSLRWTNAVLGAVTVGLAFLVVDRAGNRIAAWLAGVILAFEPFVLRSNSHVFLETLGMAVVLAGLLLIVSHLDQGTSDKRSLVFMLAGFLMGYGILTKDFFALCTVIPFAAAVIWRRTMSRQDSVTVLFAATTPYVGYMCIVVADGMLPDWLRAKTGGLERLIGFEKTTGFTAEGAPSLVSRLIDNAGHFGTSYILLGLCPLAAAILCFSYRAERRLLGLVSITLGGYGLYSAAFGTFEEQYGYGVMVAGVLSSALVCVEIVERRPNWRRAVLSSSVAMALFTCALGVRLETSTDNGFAQVKDWVEINLPADARVAVTNSTGEYAFSADHRFGVWPSAPAMLENQAQYVLTQSLPTSQGYGYMPPAMLPWLEANATPVFQLPGLTNGMTTLWFVDRAALEVGARAGVGQPSSTYETGQ